MIKKVSGNSTMAIASGILAVVLTFTYLTLARTADRRLLRNQLIAAKEPIRAVVAARDIVRGRRISPADIKTAAIPAAYIPPGGVSKRAAVIGKEASSDIYEGEIVSSNRLSGKTSRRASTAIRPGFVALAVGTDLIAGVAGAVRTGDKVDVLTTTDDSHDAFIVYSRINVLGIGGTYPYGPDDANKAEKEFAAAATGEAVILELTPEQAARVTAASEKGKIRLALRSTREAR